jgi:hypothetical protein
MKNRSIILVGQAERMWPLVWSIHIYVGYIKLLSKERNWGCGLIRMVQGSDHWLDLMSEDGNEIYGDIIGGVTSWATDGLSASQEELCFIELVLVLTWIISLQLSNLRPLRNKLKCLNLSFHWERSEGSSGFLLLDSLFKPWRWRRYSSPRCQLNFNRLQGVISWS